jgi:Phosphatidylserine/phosphatidylglycerophosphate/cardiolipin synthases and related enzymes
VTHHAAAVLRIAAACLGLGAAACASLPDTERLDERHAMQSARFESARGPLDARRSAALVAELKRKSGDLDILDRQVVLEQEIGGNPLVVGNRVVLLQDGPDTYRAMLAAISAATDHVNLESYNFEDGEVGRRFADALLERRAKGVQVNIIYDSVGAFGTAPEFFERFREAGIPVVEFNPVNPLAPGKSWAPNHRDHRKLLIVDGRTAFLGGVNISSVYASGSGLRRHDAPPGDPGGWRDTDVQVDGPVVADYQRLFLSTWEKQGGEALAAADYFPALSPRGDEIVRAIGSTPDDDYSLIYLTLIAAISSSEKSVRIVNAYFVPDPQLVRALLEAAARGVDVRIILPGHSDSDLVYNAGRSHFTQLLEGGVRIYERRGAMLHAKSATVDGVWSCVGSSNLDSRSALDNDEVNAVVLGQSFAARMQAAFALDAEASDEIDLESWPLRSLALQVKEWAAQVWSRLL